MPTTIIEPDPIKRALYLKSLRERGLVVTEKESDKIDLSDWSDVTVIEITAGKQVPEDQMTSVVSEVLREVSLSGHCPV